MFANKLQRFLGEIIGHSASRRLILNYSAQVNRPPQQLTPDDLPEIGKYLAHNIHVFVGASQADQLVQALQKIGAQK